MISGLCFKIILEEGASGWRVYSKHNCYELIIVEADDGYLGFNIIFFVVWYMSNIFYN